MNNRINIIIILFVIGLLPSKLLGVEKSDDIRIVVDVSGSMKKTDPSNLRIPALKLLNGLIPNGSQAGVWTFGRYVDMTVKWGKVDDTWRKRADKGAKQIHSNGLFTNIESALERASSGWKEPDPNTRRSIILLTDGQVDISKHAEKNKQSRQAILDKGIRALKQKSVKVHAVALSGQTDEALLKQLALETGGSFEVAKTAKELQKLFFRMFERATEPDTVKLEGNQFSVDKSVKEMTLLFFRKPGGKSTRLFPPEGKVMSTRSPEKSVWRSEDGYDLITIKKPVTGLWKFEADLDPDNRLMVVTDLKLKLDPLPAYLMPQEAISFAAELHNKGKKIKKNSFLRFVEFSLIHVDPEETENKLKLEHTKDRKKKGQYGQSFTQGLAEGSHSFVISADSRTFNRSRRVMIEVRWPVAVKIKPEDEPGNYSLFIKAREEYIKPDGLIPTVSLISPDEQQEPVIMKPARGGWLGTLKTGQNGLYQALVNIKAETKSGEKIQIDLGKFPVVGVFKESVANNGDLTAKNIEPVEEMSEVAELTQPSDQPDWMFISILAGLANLGLGIAGFGVWYFMRRMRSDPELTLEDEAIDA